MCGFQQKAKGTRVGRSRVSFHNAKTILFRMLVYWWPGAWAQNAELLFNLNHNCFHKAGFTIPHYVLVLLGFNDDFFFQFPRSV